MVDSSFAVIVDGIQHNVRASRHLTDEEWNDACGPRHECGPIKLSVNEPLISVSLTVSQTPACPVSASLTFTSRTQPIREPRFETVVAGKKMQYTRLTQLVEWNGWIRIQGKPDIIVASFWGTRDRSWGIRSLTTYDPVKEQQMTALSDPESRNAAGSKLMTLPESFRRAMSFYWLWCPINFPKLGVMYHCQELEGGRKVDNANAIIVPLLGSGKTTNDMPHIGKFGHEVLYKTGTRHAQHCRVIFAGADASVEEASSLQLRPSGVTFFMSGIGYGHPTWGHGRRHECPLAVAYDTLSINTADRMDPLHLHIQEVCFVEFENRRTNGSDVKLGDRWDSTTITRGVGTLEQLVAGLHEPSGLQHAFDVPSETVQYTVSSGQIVD